MAHAVMEYLVFAVILYFILQMMGNLVLIMRGTNDSSSATLPDGWRGPIPRRYTGRERKKPTFWDEDVRNAQWVDLEDDS
mgnify:CR=1 FL=1